MKTDFKSKLNVKNQYCREINTDIFYINNLYILQIYRSQGVQPTRFVSHTRTVGVPAGYAALRKGAPRFRRDGTYAGRRDGRLEIYARVPMVSLALGPS